MIDRHVCEGIFVHEALVDIVLDAAEVERSARGLTRNRAWLQEQQISNEWRLDRLNRLAGEAIRLLAEAGADAEVAAVRRRMSGAQKAVDTMKWVVPWALERTVTVYTRQRKWEDIVGGPDKEGVLEPVPGGGEGGREEKGDGYSEKELDEEDSEEDWEEEDSKYMTAS